MSSPFAPLDYGSAPVNAEAARAFLATAYKPPTAAAAARAAARAATAWRKAPPAERSHKLRTLGALVAERAPFLAALAALSDGRPVRITLGRDGPRAVATLVHWAGQVPLLAAASGLAAVVIEGESGIAPLVAATAPALAAGQGVVIASSVPMARALAALAAEAGLPSGLVQTITNDPSTEKALLAMPAIAHVSFTGPRNTALALRVALAASGKTARFTITDRLALVVHEDADLDGAVEGAARLLWPEAGHEVRLLVQEGVAPRFSGKLVNRLSRLRVGNVLDANTDVTDGADPAPPDIMTFRTPDEAAHLASHGAGLMAASVWSENLTFALDTAMRLQAPDIWVNGVDLHDPAAQPAAQVFPRAMVAPAAAALDAAALAQAPWAALAPTVRRAKLEGFIAKLPANSAALARRLVAAAEEKAGAARRVGPGLVTLALMEPLGVVALSPGEGTIAVLLASVLPALMAGNAVLLNAPDGAGRRTLVAAAQALEPGLLGVGLSENYLSDERLAGSFSETAATGLKAVWLSHGV